MLKQHETSEQVTEIPEILQPRQFEDVQRRDTAQETVPGTLSGVVAKDIQTARRGRKMTALLFGVPFLMMAFAPFMTATRLVPFLCVLMGWIVAFLANYSILRRMGRRLAKLEDPRASGALLDVFKTTGSFQGPDVKEALIRLLTRMKASDAEGLSREQRQFLYIILTQDQKWYAAGYDWGEDLKVAALKALEQVGDEEALPIVAQVALHAPGLPIRQAALECLPFLQMRVEEQRSRQSLLRSSAASVFPNETLLRPAAGGSETNAEELLRPTNKES
jgi:hypothetical protein